MARIKEYPSITSFDGTNDALAIEQTDGANNRLRKVSPAQLKQYMEIPKMHIVHFEVTISDMTAWGSVYEKGFNIDISSLQLTNQPSFISMELLNPDMGGWLRGYTINNANTSIGAVFTRPIVASGVIRGNVLIIE